MLGPAEDPRLEEGTIKDHLTAVSKQVEQGNFPLGPNELVLLLYRHPRHSPTLCGQRITGAGEGLLLHKELLPRSLPLLRRYNWGCLHRLMPSRTLVVF